MRTEEKFSADLRLDQWDLIVLALDHVRLMTESGASQYAVDQLSRKFLRRRIDEVVNSIQGQVPEEEKK